MASIRSSDADHRAVSPAVSRLARYCTGMRSCCTSGISPLAPRWPALRGRRDRRQRRHVPHHRQRAVFRVQRQRHLPVHRHLVDRAIARRLQPGVGDAVGARLRDHLRVVRVEEDVELGLVQVLLVRRRWRLPRCGRRRTAPRRGSGCARRRSPSTPSAGRPRCAGSRRCTSRPCPTASCSRSSCRGSPRRTCASRGTCPGRSGRCRPPRACRSSPRGRRPRRPG